MKINLSATFSLFSGFFKKTPKFGVSYSVFDGEELLEASILSIRNQVDYINVVYQTSSWYGEKAEESLMPVLLDLKARGFVDELIEYKANPKIRATKQERIKRNLGMKHAVKAGVNYFMPMDTDEFYQENELAEAKDFILANKITHSFCSIINYGTEPTMQSINDNSFFVMFFSKINPLSRLGRNKKTPCLVDPTRQLKFSCFSLFRKTFVLHQVKMHHMKLIRKDFDKKIRNSSYTVTQEQTDISQHIENHRFVDVPDQFNILPHIKQNTQPK